MKAFFSRATLLFVFLSIAMAGVFQNCAGSFHAIEPLTTANSTLKDPLTGGSRSGGSTGADPGFIDNCPQSAKSFNISSTVSGAAVYDFSASYRMDVSCADIGKDKYAFVVGLVNNVLFLFNPTSKTWVPSSSIGGSYAAFAIELPKMANQYPYTFLSIDHADLVELGGSQLFAGYGLGLTANDAAAEMLRFRDSRHAGGRYDQIYQVPFQPFSVAIQMLGTASSSFSAKASVFVKYSDYNKQGYFFIGARSPATDLQGNAVTRKWMLYSGTTWVEFTGSNAVAVGGQQALRNKELNLNANAKTADVAGWELYAGYGVGENLNSAFSLVADNSQGTRNNTGYTIPADPGQIENKNNWDVQSTLSGNVSSYSAMVNIKVADADGPNPGKNRPAGKKGYYLFGAIIDGKGYILDTVNKNWHLVDGSALSGFSAPINLQSTTSPLSMVKDIDVTMYGGAIILAGYGVGDNIKDAVDECLREKRWKQLDVVPKQAFSGQVKIPEVYDKDSSQLYSVEFLIYPDYRDYGTPGKYYVAAVAPSPSTDILVLSGVSWVKYEGIDQNDSLFTNSTTALKNYSRVEGVKGSDIKAVVGWRIFVGYGKNIQDMLDRRLHNEGVLVAPSR